MAGQVSVCVCVVKQSTHQGGLKRSERVEYGTFKNLKTKPTKIEKCFLQLKPDKHARVCKIYTYFLCYAAKPVELEWVCPRSCGTWSQKMREATNFNTIQPSTHTKKRCLRVFAVFYWEPTTLTESADMIAHRKKHNIQRSSARRKH